MVILTLLPCCYGSNVTMTVMVTMLHGNDVTMTAESSNNNGFGRDKDVGLNILE